MENNVNATNIYIDKLICMYVASLSPCVTDEFCGALRVFGYLYRMHEIQHVSSSKSSVTQFAVTAAYIHSTFVCMFHCFFLLFPSTSLLFGSCFSVCCVFLLHMLYNLLVAQLKCYWIVACTAVSVVFETSSKPNGKFDSDNTNSNTKKTTTFSIIAFGFIFLVNRKELESCYRLSSGQNRVLIIKQLRN